MTTPAWDGAKLRQLRISRGWTREQLAVQIGRSAARIRAYEVDQPPPPLIASRIAAALQVPLDTLLTSPAGTDG